MDYSNVTDDDLELLQKDENKDNPYMGPEERKFEIIKKLANA